MVAQWSSTQVAANIWKPLVAPCWRQHNMYTDSYGRAGGRDLRSRVDADGGGGALVWVRL